MRQPLLAFLVVAALAGCSDVTQPGAVHNPVAEAVTAEPSASTGTVLDTVYLTKFQANFALCNQFVVDKYELRAGFLDERSNPTVGGKLYMEDNLAAGRRIPLVFARPRDNTLESVNVEVYCKNAVGLLSRVGTQQWFFDQRGQAVTHTNGSQSATWAIDWTPVSYTPASVRISVEDASLNAGESSFIEVQQFAANGTQIFNSLPSWTNDDPLVATLTHTALTTGTRWRHATAIVKGLAGGYSNLTARFGPASATTRIDVTGPPPPVASVRIFGLPSVVYRGESRWLTARAYDAYGHEIAGKTPTWSSADPSVAYVHSSGELIPNGDGSTTIYATIDGVVGSAPVTIVTPGFSGVTVNQQNPAPAYGTCYVGAQTTGGSGPFTYEWFVDGVSVGSGDGWGGLYWTNSGSSYTVSAQVTETSTGTVHTGSMFVEVVPDQGPGCLQ